MTAATLCRMYGREVDGYSWNYIARHADEAKPEAVGRACIRVLAKAQKIIRLIFQGAAEGEQQQVEVEVIPA